MLFQCCASVADDGPPLKQHWVNASCLLGSLDLLHWYCRDSKEMSTCRCLYVTLHLFPSCFPTFEAPINLYNRNHFHEQTQPPFVEHSLISQTQYPFAGRDHKWMLSIQWSTSKVRSSSSSKSLLYVTFQHKWPFKGHYNTIKTCSQFMRWMMCRWWGQGGGDRAWRVIAQTAGDLGFVVQFNAETLWHSAQLRYPRVG